MSRRDHSPFVGGDSDDDDSGPEGVEYLTGYDDDRYEEAGSRDPSPRGRPSGPDDERHPERTRRSPSPRAYDSESEEERETYRPRYASPERNARGAAIGARGESREGRSESPPTHRRAPMSRGPSPTRSDSRDPSPEPRNAPRARMGGRYCPQHREADSDTAGSEDYSPDDSLESDSSGYDY